MRRRGPVYRFGRFRLDTAERALFCAGEPVHLTLKAFSVLQILIENARHVVDKDELMQPCWPNSFVEEANLVENVSLIRRALGESRNQHEYIETVHKRGYRFIAVVSVADDASQRTSETIRASLRLAVCFGSRPYGPGSGRTSNRIAHENLWGPERDDGFCQEQPGIRLSAIRDKTLRTAELKYLAPTRLFLTTHCQLNARRNKRRDSGKMNCRFAIISS